MILQALKEYYDRKPELPRQGFEEKEIPYILTLKNDGTPVSLYPTFEGEGKKKRAKKVLVPQSVKRSVGIVSNLLWDNPEYALGVVIKGKPERVIKQHNAFKEKVFALNIDDQGLSAVKAFLSKDDKAEILSVMGESWNELLESGANLTFQLAGDIHPVLERPAVKRVIEHSINNVDDETFCFVSGEQDQVERLHASIKGVYGAQSSGANIVSFNLDAFNSFSKKQGENAPVGKRAAFAYTTALNHMLGKDSKQRLQVGDASVVFWAGKDSNFEQIWSDFFSESPKDDPDRGVRAVESLLKAPQIGAFKEDDNQVKFYVLGLSPNASRISVRFWIIDTIASMAEKIAQHFLDLRIVHGPRDRDVFSLFRLLVSIAVLGKSENIPPNLAGETMRAILLGLPYPQTLLQAAVRRIRAEHEITYIRAALIKACINRTVRFKNSSIKEELKMSLDECNKNIGYRLGRLFAALEKIQLDANPGINATIRDRFYGAASGTPVVVFGNLMRLKNHHLAKFDNPGHRVFFEKLLGEIMEGVDAKTAFPSHLSLVDQGRFAVGYYHQMQAFYTKKSDRNESKGENNEQSN
jgi:CRISPR-associated protein Csd1